MQTDLFGEPDPSLPSGFRYMADVVSPEMQAEVLAALQHLAFEAFNFHGFEGKRRVVSFGWRYDFTSEKLVATDPIPPFLLSIQEVAAEFAGLSSASLQQTLVSEYGPGAPIGWHRDKAVFGRIVGISLLSPCEFRLRRKTGTKWERAKLTAEPGSAYLLSGPSRTEWEHSIPPVDQLRYSITFRELLENRR